MGYSWLDEAGGLKFPPRVCPTCGKSFQRTDVGNYRWYMQSKYCSENCEAFAFEPRVTALKQSGEPMVTVSDDGITCNICGNHMQQVGAHFQRKHGFPTPKTRLERLYMLQLPMGFRICTPAFRQFFKKNMEMICAQTGNPGKGTYDLEKMNAANKRDSGLRKAVPVSEKMLVALRENQLQGAYAKHVNACQPRVCKQCGAEFSLPRHRKDFLCGRECNAKWRTGKNPVSPEGRAIITAGVKAYHAAKREHRACQECGIVFSATRSEPKLCCSKSCGMKQSCKRRKAAGVVLGGNRGKGAAA